MFVSLTGYWLGHKDYLIRTRRIAAAQEAACNECDILCVGSKRAMTYHEEKLVIDDVHYSQEGLNILGKDLSNNIGILILDFKLLFLLINGAEFGIIIL